MADSQMMVRRYCGGKRVTLSETRKRPCSTLVGKTTLFPEFLFFVSVLQVLPEMLAQGKVPASLYRISWETVGTPCPNAVTNTVMISNYYHVVKGKEERKRSLLL